MTRRIRSPEPLYLPIRQDSMDPWLAAVGQCDTFRGLGMRVECYQYNVRSAAIPSSIQI
jgi:hypothetical protein